MPVLVTGGTGTVGRLVVARLREAGQEVRVLSRHPAAGAGGVDSAVADLGSGAGVAAALKGVRTVVHCAGSARGDEAKAGVLVRAAAVAGVTHLVHISVVGWTGSRSGAGSTTPSSATTAPSSPRSGSSSTPGSPTRCCGPPSSTTSSGRSSVSSRSCPWYPCRTGGSNRSTPVRWPTGSPPSRSGRRPVGCPTWADRDATPLTDLVRAHVRATSRRRPLLPVRLPGQAARAFAAGANLATDDATLGTRTWEQFVAHRLGDRAHR